MTAPAALPEWGAVHVKDFWEFAAERMAVHQRRQSGIPRPWTNDLVMQKRFFTNCFREDDPGTAVAREIMGRTDRHQAERLWNLILYRRFNRESVWRDHIGYMEWDDDEPGKLGGQFKAAYERLHGERAAGRSVFTDAHQVNPLVRHAAAGPQLLERVMKVGWEDLGRSVELWEKLSQAEDIKKCFKAFVNMKFPGIAGFLSWQIVLDSRYGPDPIVTHSDDQWAPVQAGARVGLILYRNWPTIGLVKGGGSSSSVSRAKREAIGEAAESGEWPLLEAPKLAVLEAEMAAMRDAQDDEFARRKIDFTDLSSGRRMTMGSIEHTLCEWQKYVGVSTGLPSSKRAFKETA